MVAKAIQKFPTNVKRILLIVAIDNARAKEFYENLGFKKINQIEIPSLTADVFELSW